MKQQQQLHINLIVFAALRAYNDIYTYSGGDMIRNDFAV